MISHGTHNAASLSEHLECRAGDSSGSTQSAVSACRMPAALGGGYTAASRSRPPPAAGDAAAAGGLLADAGCEGAAAC